MTSIALPSPRSVAWSLLSFVAATFWAVLIWLAFLSAVTIGTPPPAPQCRAIHDGEVLVASTLHPDGSLT